MNPYDKYVEDLKLYIERMKPVIEHRYNPLKVSIDMHFLSDKITIKLQLKGSNGMVFVLESFLHHDMMLEHFPNKYVDSMIEELHDSVFKYAIKTIDEVNPYFLK